MQLTNLAAAAAFVASVSATGSFASDASLFNGNSSCDASLSTTVKVVNRCNHDVYLWSVLKGQACPSSAAAVLSPGQFYHENFRPAAANSGVSLKLSKDSTCTDGHIAQFEYFIENSAEYGANYFDMSYVNCQSKDCPTADTGYYMISGNQEGYPTIAGANPTLGASICPILSCSDFESCASCSYVLPDDVQTKSCNKDAPLTLYMCGAEAPGEESQPASSAASSSSQVSSSSSSSSSASSAKAYIEAAAITSAPVSSAQPINVKTEVVYVTEAVYVNAKRHAHGHRHQHFRA